MNSQTHNSNWNNQQPSLASMVSPLRIELSQTTEGWCVEISSLSPCDAMMVLTREDMLENSTILSGSQTTNGFGQWVACVRGPVELGDANAIVHNVEYSDSPLKADLRMHSIVHSKDGESTRAHVREYDDALALAATAIAKYTSSILGDTCSSPDLGLVDSVLDRTGLVSIRPIETEIFSTFVDVGISTNGPSSPADSVLIYDIHSDSWHGE
ncbi:MAG: hypothetical protein HOC27_01315 [Phycisphaerae bacterium]|nr:hypothetical protein [Phycisphaerae bacterium]